MPQKVVFLHHPYISCSLFLIRATCSSYTYLISQCPKAGIHPGCITRPPDTHIHSHNHTFIGSNQPNVVIVLDWNEESAFRKGYMDVLTWSKRNVLYIRGRSFHFEAQAQIWAMFLFLFILVSQSFFIPFYSTISCLFPRVTFSLCLPSHFLFGSFSTVPYHPLYIHAPPDLITKSFA